MLHSVCQYIWKTHQWPQDWKRSVFIPIPKKGNTKECSNYCKVALILHACKVILKILQVRLQQYLYWELLDVQTGFRKGRGTRDQIAKIHWIIEKARVPEKHLLLLYWLCQNLLTVWTTTSCGKFLEMRIPENTCLLRNLNANQEATVRTRHGTTVWFKIGKWVCQGCILWPCLFNLYAEGKWKLLSCVPTICDPMDYVYSPWNSPG